MKTLIAVAKDVWGLVISLWWMMAGVVLLMAVAATVPWLIEHFEKVQWLPLAYLIWGFVGCVALVAKANEIAMHNNHLVALLRERRAERERMAKESFNEWLGGRP